MNGVYYTPNDTGRHIVASLHPEQAQRIIDLGAGSGRLLRAAAERWPEAELHAADTCPVGLTKLAARLPQASCHQIDALRHDLPKRLGLEEASVDLAVCNPPYVDAPGGSKSDWILRAAGLDGCLPMRLAGADVLFIAQNLRLLRPGGTLAVIVPEGLVTGYLYRSLRERLLEQHGLYKVISLPRNCFKNTETSAHVLFLHRDAGASKRVCLSGLGGQQTWITADEAAYRMDLAYHQAARERLQGLPLSVLNGVSLQRGRHGHKPLTEAGIDHFHTTHFKWHECGRIRLPVSGVELDKAVLARPGDILLPRVGSRCLHHAALLEEGAAILSDCVYRLVVPDKWREIVWQRLRSKAGIEWRQQVSHGTCARVLTRENIFAFPGIPFE